MIRIGVIGFGYWGPNLVRNFMAAGAEVMAVCDISLECLAIAKTLYPSLQLTQEAEDLFQDHSLDAIAIATPLSTHYNLALRAISTGKHIWLEKPMAQTTDECLHLTEEANDRRLICMIDFPYVFSPAVTVIRNRLCQCRLGQLFYYDSVRTNLGRFQPDVDVLGDLASHDLSILNFLLEDSPCMIQTVGATHLKGDLCNLAYLTLNYPRGFLAHIHVNWLAPAKLRRIMLTGSERMILWDDLVADEKLKIYDYGIETVFQENDLIDVCSAKNSKFKGRNVARLATTNDFGKAKANRTQRIGYRSGNVCSPRLEVVESLQLAATHFLECISSGNKPLTSGEMGLRIAQWLEKARISLINNGRPVEIKPFPISSHHNFR